MVVVQEEENFWSEEDWLELLEKYYNPLIDAGAIDNFKYEVIPDENYYKVRRSFFDWRARSLDQRESVGCDPGPCGDPGWPSKPLPPQLKIDAEVTVTGGDGVDAFEFIQNYKDYWPASLDMKCYAVGQAKDEECYMILSFANYDPPEEEGCAAEYDEDEDDEEEYGDVMYDEE